MRNDVWHLIKRFRLLVALSISAILLSYLIILYILFPAFMNAVCVEGVECDWGLLEGYSSLIGLAILIGGLVFAVREYTRQEAQISFQMYEAIHDRLTDPAEEAARRWIILNIEAPGEELPKEQWYEKTAKIIHKRPEGWERELSPGHESIKRTLNTLDYFGFIAENYVNVEGPLLEWMSAPIAKVWERIGTYIEIESEAKAEPDYYKSAVYIGNKCMEWREKQGLESEIIKAGI